NMFLSLRFNHLMYELSFISISIAAECLTLARSIHPTLEEGLAVAEISATGVAMNWHRLSRRAELVTVLLVLGSIFSRHNDEEENEQEELRRHLEIMN
ncbi:hypothetical protein PMAYCL1PPCAC_05092, partial [Pristionchus mayeri]